MLLAFAFSSLAFAADGGDLNKEQRTAEKMMTALEGDAATSYATFAPALSAELSKTMDQKNFTAIQRQVKQQFGSLKETKFFSFERYDQADKVTYIAGFSKEKIVVMSFVFGKDAKLQTSASLRTKHRNKLLLKRNKTFCTASCCPSRGMQFLLLITNLSLIINLSKNF